MQFWAKVKPKQSSPIVPKIGGEVSQRETSTPTTFPRIEMSLNLLNLMTIQLLEHKHGLRILILKLNIHTLQRSEETRSASHKSTKNTLFTLLTTRFSCTALRLLLWVLG
ncbi:hypothetical protein TNCV_3222591 [Trichonephila clavipes]|uniref:Uncharacterized protein n=1 Tax=Trichonephila clavipes TaxID=2585209 RepID=A0A8X6V1D1_TRICX|nr:hypothetical protein TNCV_3222591 [Trichonephila clavipes]